MRMTEKQLRSVIREAIIKEGPMADTFQGAGAAASKVATVPASIVAKALGRLSSDRNSRGFERDVDRTAKATEQAVGKALGLIGSGVDLTFKAFSKLVQGIGLTDDQKKRLYDGTKRAGGGGKRRRRRQSGRGRDKGLPNRDQQHDKDSRSGFFF